MPCTLPEQQVTRQSHRSVLSYKRICSTEHVRDRGCIAEVFKFNGYLDHSKTPRELSLSKGQLVYITDIDSIGRP